VLTNCPIGVSVNAENSLRSRDECGWLYCWPERRSRRISIDPEVDFAAIWAQFDTLLMGRRRYEAASKRLGEAAFTGIWPMGQAGLRGSENKQLEKHILIADMRTQTLSQSAII